MTLATEPEATLKGLDDATRIAFHMAEFTALKSDLADHIKSTTANLQYALLASAGVFAWTLNDQSVGQATRDHTRALSLAVWLPFLLSNVFGLYSILIRVRIGKEVQYVRKLEALFSLQGLGFEGFLHNHLVLVTWLQTGAWTLLIVGDAALALAIRS